MTLIVYKNGILAADSRTSITRGHGEKNTCGHCDNPIHEVSDTSEKINVFTDKEAATFRGEKVLAMTGTGSKHLIERLRTLMKTGGDLEASYVSYLAVAGDQTDRSTSCTLLFVCAAHCYLVKVPVKGALIVTQEPRDKDIVLGSTTKAVEWISYLMKSLSATQLINVGMAMHKGIGGPIRYVEFDAPELLVETFAKFDPQELVDSLADIFKVGQETIAAQTKASAAKKPIRKPAAKKEVKNEVYTPRTPKSTKAPERPATSRKPR